jgi:hypothetical protein
MEAEPPSLPSGVRFRRLWALVRPYLGPLLLSRFLIGLDGGVVLAAPQPSFACRQLHRFAPGTADIAKANGMASCPGITAFVLE